MEKISSAFLKLWSNSNLYCRRSKQNQMKISKKFQDGLIFTILPHLKHNRKIYICCKNEEDIFIFVEVMLEYFVLIIEGTKKFK